MSLINKLLKERKILTERISAIDTLLETYQAEEYLKREKPRSLLDKLDEGIDTIHKVRESYKDIFNYPLDARRDKKVLWLFENNFNSFVKFNEVQEAFNRFNGLSENKKEIRIDNIARTLKKNGELVVLKYNNSNILSFWGLSSWVDENNEVRQDCLPNKDLLPVKIESLEIIKE